MKQTRLHSLPVAAIALLALVATACGSPDTRGDTTSPGSDDAAARSYVRQVWDLGEPVSGIESSALYALAMDTITFDPSVGKAQRVCGGSQRCFAHFMSVANQKPGPRTLGPDGTIVARLENIGNAAGANNGLEKKYGLPRAAKNTVYLMIAFAEPNDEWRWEIYSAVKDAPAGSRPIRISGGRMINCNHPPGPVRERGRFRTCDSLRVAGTTTGTTTGGPLFPPDEEPGWLSCSAGCCTAGQ